MSKWEYGGAYARHDMGGTIELPHGSRVRVCDWTRELPDFMLEADALFIDPPWNAANARSFYTKAGIDGGPISYPDFSARLWRRVEEIAPRHLFLEMGKQHLADHLQEARRRFPHVTFYNSTYYHRRSNKCYVIHASRERGRYAELEDMDEEHVIAWVCARHAYDCIGDLCMGRGLVGRHAYLNGRRFVGTELNPKRLAVLVDFIRGHQQKGRA